MKHLIFPCHPNHPGGDIYQAIRMEQVYPLDVAEALGNDKMVRLLVEAGAVNRTTLGWKYTNG